MAEFSLNSSAPNLTVVCVDSIKPEIGRIYNYYTKAPIIMDSLSSILDAIGNLCDEIDYPQQSTKPRSFIKTKKEMSEGFEPEAKERKKVVNKKELLNKRGDEGTFVVHIKYRQNATWQGQVTWVDKEQTQNFRSALELLKLIDSALDSGNKKKEGEHDNE